MDNIELCCNCGQPVTKTPKERNDDIIKVVANKYGILSSTILSDARNKLYVHARHEVMYYLHLKGYSTVQIGKMLNRDHSTVLNGIKQHKIRLERNAP